MKENSEIIINRLIHPLNNIEAHISELKMFFNLFSTTKNIIGVQIVINYSHTLCSAACSVEFNEKEV